MSLEDVEWTCFTVRVCSSVAHVRPGHQGPPLACTGQPCCTCHYYVPRVYVRFLFSVGVLLSWRCSKDCCDCILVRRCRTRVFYFRRLGYCHSVSATTLCEAGVFVLLEALLYIQQPLTELKESLSSLMMVTDVEHPSLPQSASQGVLSIVSDNPVNFPQAAGMPHPRSVLTGTYVLCYMPYFFSSPASHTTLVISGYRFTSRLYSEGMNASLFPA